MPLGVGGEEIEQNPWVTGVIISQGMLIWIVLNIAVMMPVFSPSHAHPLP